MTIFLCICVQNIALPRPSNGGTANNSKHHLGVRAEMERFVLDSPPGANFIELFKHKACLTQKLTKQKHC